MKLLIVLALTITGVHCFGQKLKTICKAGYCIKYPDNWLVDNARGKGSTTAINLPAESDQDASYVDNLYINIEEATSAFTSALTYSSTAKKTLPARIKNFKIISEAAQKVGGKNSYYMIFKGKQGNDALQWRQQYFVENGKIYIITFTCDEPKFKSLEPTLKSIFESFTIK